MEDNQITRVLYNQGSLAIGAVALISSAIFWITNPQTALEKDVIKLQAQVETNATVAEELSKIKNNDLHEMQLRMDRIEARQIEELQSIARIEALLKR